MDFYAQCRTAYLDSRRSPREPACERLYAAIQAGQDPEAVLTELQGERDLSDPRLLLERC
jgi:hypothetical protein